VEVHAFPEGIELAILPAGAEERVRPYGFAWRFRDSGLNDPVTLRLSAGDSYTELRFHALTGRAEEETFLE